EIPSSESKVHIEVLSVLWGNRLLIPDGRHRCLGTPSRRRSLKERLGPRHARSMSRSPEPRRDRSKSPRESDPERRTVFKRLENAVEIRKTATRVLAPEKQKFLLRNIVTKEIPRKEQKHYQKAKAAQEDIGNQNQRSKSRALRMTCPNHGL
ncbi:hypothetical protein Tco_0041655, partial [Tanacetum coccineum]